MNDTSLSPEFMAVLTGALLNTPSDQLALKFRGSHSTLLFTIEGHSEEQANRLNGFVLIEEGLTVFPGGVTITTHPMVAAGLQAYVASIKGIV